MTQFMDGPAKGVTLALRRSPRFLRVVESRYADSPERRFDALDQLNDSPGAGEIVHVYARVGQASSVHLRGTLVSGWFKLAQYRYFETQPDRDTTRDTDKWREWATARAMEMMERTNGR